MGPHVSRPGHARVLSAALALWGVLGLPCNAEAAPRVAVLQDGLDANKIKFTLTREPGRTILDVPAMKMKSGLKGKILKKALEAELAATLLAKGANTRIEVQP